MDAEISNLFLFLFLTKIEIILEKGIENAFLSIACCLIKLLKSLFLLY